MQTFCWIIFWIIHITVLATAQDRSHWYEQAKGQLQRNLQSQRYSGQAKNLILFVGDGMGLTTITAARILRGQQSGSTGEEAELAFDKFEHIALAKTYNIDSQVGDSGACATALLSGVKGRFETVGLDENAIYDNCLASVTARVPSLADWAQHEGKATGLVTTTRVTHATPAAMFGHAASRYWESDDKMPEHSSCKDLARQLLEDDPGKNINVILGGGRRHLLPHWERDPEHRTEMGRRKDGRNLIDEWQRDKKDRDLSFKYVWRKDDFDSVDTQKTDYLLGLFDSSHLAFETDRDGGPEGEPSLAEMTRKALEILQRNPHGYFLMVEGGRIDHSHHFNNAHRALVDTLALEDAVSVALQMTKPEDTLMVVTADHSHVLAFGGYPKRGNPILGVDDRVSDVDAMPYTTLLYANGPGYDRSYSLGRQNITQIDTNDKNYVQQAAVPRRWDTHGGEDVPVYAHGAMSHLFRGVVEQTFVPHAMAFAACIGPGKTHCHQRKDAEPLQGSYFRPTRHLGRSRGSLISIRNSLITFLFFAARL